MTDVDRGWNVCRAVGACDEHPAALPGFESIPVVLGTGQCGLGIRNRRGGENHSNRSTARQHQLLQAIDALLHRSLQLQVVGDLLIELADLLLRAFRDTGHALEGGTDQLAAHQVLSQGRCSSGEQQGQACRNLQRSEHQRGNQLRRS